MPAGGDTRRVRDLDAVTVDALGTIVALRDPVPALQAALAARAVERDSAAVAEAFAAEVAVYVPRSHEGRTPESLAALRLECAGVFLDAAEAPIAPEDFVDDFLKALVFAEIPGAALALDRLRALGLRLACVANWDMSLPDQLARVGLAEKFDAIVSSAEAVAPKPNPAPFLVALGRLGVVPSRALHIGDSEADRLGAAAVGMRFAVTPVSTLPARLEAEAA
jgi:HAD superfamily hydrolase (TIGR01509 family)